MQLPLAAIYRAIRQPIDCCGHSITAYAERRDRGCAR